MYIFAIFAIFQNRENYMQRNFIIIIIIIHAYCLFTGCLPVLTSLQISHNKLKYAADIEELVNCPQISVLDLSHNKIEDPDIVNVFERMQSLVSSNLRYIPELI